MGKIKKIIPLIILIMCLGGAYYWTQYQKTQPFPETEVAIKSENNIKPAQILQRPNAVLVDTVKIQVVNNRLEAIGTGRADATVAVTPWSSGVMDTLFVKAGEKVKAQDPIAKLDSDNEEIAVERAKVQVNDAELTLARTVKLRATNTATEVQEINAKLTLENAKLALRDAELALDRRTIRAPISGIVGILPVDAGNYVTSDTTIARIDNRDQILVDIWVPERFAPLIHIGDDVSATSIARPGENFKGKISAIDNMIDEQSRTLRIRAEIDNKTDSLRSGMSFAMSLRFSGDPFPTVDPLAIQWNGEGAFVWRVVNDKVERVPVAIVQRNTNSVLVNAALNEGDRVVVQGVQNIHQGSQVSVLNQKTERTNTSDKNATGG